jgi:hypothetical protein
LGSGVKAYGGGEESRDLQLGVQLAWQLNECEIEEF